MRAPGGGDWIVAELERSATESGSAEIIWARGPYELDELSGFVTDVMMGAEPDGQEDVRLSSMAERALEAQPTRWGHMVGRSVRGGAEPEKVS